MAVPRTFQAAESVAFMYAKVESREKYCSVCFSEGAKKPSFGNAGFTCMAHLRIPE